MLRNGCPLYDEGVEAAGAEFMNDLFSVLGLEMKRVLAVRLGVENRMVMLTTTQVLVRPHGMVATAVLQRSRSRVYLDKDLLNRPVAAASGSAPGGRPT